MILHRLLNSATMTSSFCSIYSFSPCFVRDPRFTIASYTNPSSSFTPLRYRFRFGLRLNRDVDRRRIRSVVAAAAGPMLFPENPLVGDTIAMVISGSFALSILRVYEETARRGIFDQVCAVILF